VLVFVAPGLHQIKQAGFGQINPAKGFRLLQAEAFIWRSRHAARSNEVRLAFQAAVKNELLA
jgi:hypothetical protein